MPVRGFLRPRTDEDCHDRCEFLSKTKNRSVTPWKMLYFGLESGIAVFYENIFAHVQNSGLEQFILYLSSDCTPNSGVSPEHNSELWNYLSTRQSKFRLQQHHSGFILWWFWIVFWRTNIEARGHTHRHRPGLLQFKHFNSNPMWPAIGHPSFCFPKTKKVSDKGQELAVPR